MAGRGAACWGIGARGPQERPTMVSGAEGATQVAVGNITIAQLGGFFARFNRLFTRSSEKYGSGVSSAQRIFLLLDTPVPVATPAMPMYMVWHLRRQHDPAHRWLREAVEAIVGEALA